MGCGCGGSKRVGPQTRQAARRDGGSKQTAATPRAAGGFTWNGPQRAEPKPQQA